MHFYGLIGRRALKSGNLSLQVEQLHKIFKLCGSPSEEYWKKTKLPHATIFKPQQPYKRIVSETFKDFPSSALSLLEVLLAIEPKDRGTATSALQNEVALSHLINEFTLLTFFYQLFFLVKDIFFV